MGFSSTRDVVTNFNDPTFTEPDIRTSIDDINGAELIKITATTAAINEITIANAATAGTPSITASGDDTNIDLAIAGKGTGSVDLGPTLKATDIDAGSSGTAGSVDVFPTTASSGKLSLTCTDQAGDTAVTINANAMGQATTVNMADPGAAASYIVQSTAAITLAEADVLDAAIAGTQVAEKAVIADSNINTGISKVTELHIGASGSEVQISATPAEIDLQCDISAQTEAVTTGAISVTKRITVLDTTAGAVLFTLAAPDATMYGQVKVISFGTDNGDATLTLTNVQGGSAATTCTWANVGEELVLVGGSTKWAVISEAGVVLS